MHYQKEYIGSFLRKESLLFNRRQSLPFQFRSVNFNYVRALRSFPSKLKRVKRILLSAEVDRKNKSFPKKIAISQLEKLFFVIYSVLTLAMILVMFWRNLNSNISPYDTILTNPVSRFGDYYGLKDEWVRFGWSSPGYGMLYLPSMYLPVELLATLEPNPYKSVVLLLLGMSIYLMFVTAKLSRVISSSVSRKVLNLCLVYSCYPVWFIYGSANLEGFLLLSIFIAYLFLCRSQNNLAALWIGIAASFKVFPVFFLLIFLSLEKVNYRRLGGFFLLGFIGPNLLAILILQHGILASGFDSISKIVRNTIASQKMYSELMYFSESGTHFGHSFLNGIHSILGEGYWPTRSVYAYSWALLTIFCLLPVIINLLGKQKMNLFSLSIVIAVTSCLAPPTSTDYKLWYFLPACLIFITIPKPTHIENAVFLLLPILLVAKPYLYTGVQPWANANSYISPLIMVLMIVMLVLDSLIKLFRRAAYQADTKSFT